MQTGMARPTPRRRARQAGAPAESGGRQYSEAGRRCRIDVSDNPIATRDPLLGEAAERAVDEALKNEDLGTVRVRFSLWRDGSRSLKFVCKVEAPGDEVTGTPPWRWWSLLTRNPEQLHDDLARGLQARRERLGFRSFALAQGVRGGGC